MTRTAFAKIADGLADAITYSEGVADRSAYRVHAAQGVDMGDTEGGVADRVRTQIEKHDQKTLSSKRG